MNRIENRLAQLQEKGEKAFITYMTAGLPDMEGTKNIIKAQEKAGTDILELGIPFSDPVADGPVIQAASYESILKGTSIHTIFEMMADLRKDCEIPIIFMMYYNTILHYGVEKFVDKCIETGVDGLIVPDLPKEEQGEIREFLGKENAPILIQLVSPVSKQRIPEILKDARGFVYCVSSMGVTGQDGGFHRTVVNYLKEVKEQSKIPVMMGFGIKEAGDVKEVRDIIDGAIVGSHFIKLMKENNYDLEAITAYIKKFKAEL
jgi:tryptophan synthase alpha chain